MTDNTREKQHLRKQGDILKDIEETNPIAETIKKESLDLISNLTNSKDLFVDSEVATALSNISSRLNAGAPGNIVNDASIKYAALQAQKAALEALLPIVPPPTTAQTNLRIAQHGDEVKEIKAKMKDLETITGPGGGAAGGIKLRDRRTEYNDLSTHANYFNIPSKINPIDIDLLVGPPRTTTIPADIDQDLDALFKVAGATNAEYKLCDEKGVPLVESTPGKYTMTVGSQTVTLSGIDFSARKLDLKNLKITPSNIDLSEPIKLSINGIYKINTATGNNINLICNKKFELKLRKGAAADTEAKRKVIVKDYNDAGSGRTIQNKLTTIYQKDIAKIERESFFKALEKNDGPKLAKLTEDQKEELYQNTRKIYKGYRGGGPLPIRAGGLLPSKIRNYDKGADNFVDRISSEKHESNNSKYTENENSYTTYIHNNIEEQVTKFFEFKFDKIFSENNDGNTYLKAQLTNYLTEIEKQKVDNDVHQDIMGDIDAVDRMENRRKVSVDINGRNYGLGRRDVNYLRFFAGQDSKVEVKEQTVNITTNNKPEDLNNEEPVKYDMNMEVSGKQQILVNVKIGKNKEIKLKAGDPAAMVKRILQCEDIQHGKVRAHVVYNVMKGFIQAAKKKDISLTYRDPGTGDLMVIKMDGENIVLEQQDNATNYGGTHRRNTTVLFDQKYFENSNTFDSTSGHENRRLRVGIDKLMGHFNFAMNELHYQYRQASERKRMGLRRGATRMTLPTSFFLSPIKKILNFRTTTNFDFSTTVQSNGKSVSIDLKKNKFTLNIDGLKKPISSRTLGKLLRYRKGGVRIFDGMERDICGKIYEELIKKMRENTKIARTNFGVKDYITGRTYILDADGQLGYVTAEQAAANQNMIRRGAMSGRDYGIVNNPPTGRVMCDESETREVMKNPFLMGRLIKTMNNRMGIVSSTRALLN